MDKRVKLSLYVIFPMMFLLQCFVALSFVVLSLAAGGLDLLNDPPGVIESVKLLLFACPLTLIAFIVLLIYPKIKQSGHIAGIMLPIVLLNGAIAIEVMKYLSGIIWLIGG